MWLNMADTGAHLTKARLAKIYLNAERLAMRSMQRTAKSINILEVHVSLHYLGKYF